MTLTVFNDGSKFVSGNRCERGAEKAMQIKVAKAEKKSISLITSIKNFSNLNHSTRKKLSMVKSVFRVF
jgi:hypothetical protein